jgi:hypothetical protein
MNSFLIPANETPEQAALRKRKAVSQALTAPMPQNVGEGLASLGNALTMRQQQQNAAFPAIPGGEQASFMTAMRNLFSNGRNGGLY